MSMHIPLSYYLYVKCGCYKTSKQLYGSHILTNIEAPQFLSHNYFNNTEFFRSTTVSYVCMYIPHAHMSLIMNHDSGS